VDGNYHRLLVKETWSQRQGEECKGKILIYGRGLSLEEWCEWWWGESPGLLIPEVGCKGRLLVP
jgi:hypothetical protein